MNTDPLIYVADDDDGVRRSLAMLLEGAGYRVETFPSGEAMLAAMEATPAPSPRCAVVDVRMGDGMNGVEVQQTLARRPGPGLPVVMVTGHGDIPLAVAAMRAGVRDFIEKPYPPDKLLAAIAETLSASVSSASPPRTPVPALMALTPRERDVLVALVAGQSNKEIARIMGISHRTVEGHRAALMTRLGARSLADVVRMGLAAGLGSAHPAG
ncbi:response regulator transcription factor [Acidisphaera sp. L21]|uniref:response regulator transcription factor n=1 Tax=Acidisphaera sp. L21 TaxID=1641851 RepID=UPI00131C8E1C|nr:response regulator [Acidisphaera sp. L21]